ncbi:hypothetical protein [Hoeflea poritis]|uniref:Uncharacterized protein n=1 Tax=Hoeflea poritis TaxID=2993659 RepID=A0ABT4VPK5_9HYPH|nr:hypothetical protein [Hoeflea poritis]MDA4845948.1 hypothetical protein [Hoeflea poritis]
MMPLVDIDDFLPLVKLYARTVPDVVAERFIRKAARDFCRKTRIWHDIYTMTVKETLDQTACSIPDAEILEIEHAKIGDQELIPKTPAELDEMLSDWSDATVTAGSSSYITQLGANSISLVPRQAGSLRMRLFLIPTKDAYNLPAILHDEHGEAIGQGAAAGALLVPGTEYTNPGAAADLRREFNRLCATQKWRGAKNKAGARLRSKGRYF